MVDRVRTALDASALDRIYAVTSPHAPGTAAHVDLPTIEAAGEGYVPDLQAALADDRVSRPVLTVAADLPLLAGCVIDAFLAGYGSGALTVAVPVGRVVGLGFSVDTTWRRGGRAVRPAGLNVVDDGGETLHVTRDYRVAANVNRPGDRHRAEWLLAGDRSTD